MAATTKKILDKTCISTSFLCEAFGVTRQAVNEWEKKGCPKVARGWWCLTDVLAWRDQQAKETDQKLEDMPLTMQKTYWETRCKEEQAEKEKFKNAVLRGDYLEKAAVESDLATFFVIFKQAVMSMPRKLAIVAAQYVGNEKARLMERDAMEVINDALEQWSAGSFQQKAADDSKVDVSDAKNPKAPRKNQRGAVGGRKPNTGRKKQQ